MNDSDRTRAHDRAYQSERSSERATTARRRIVPLALLAAALGALHHLDHIVRANHVGWPVVPQVTPFTFSLLVYPLLLVGAYLTARHRVGAWYWLAISIPILALVVNVHFNPAPEGEQVKDLYLPYAEPAAYCAKRSAADPPVGRSELCDPAPSPGRPILGALSVADMLALVVTLIVLVVTSAREVWRARRTPAVGIL
ncbi:MAG: hypothetical protein M3336_04875 [Chloroflexota bacterium]|nr:hypothetical protein [Chloroflexota bacterium]